MSNPLRPESIDAIIAFQNTAAWADLMAACRAQLPAFASVTAIPDVAAASAHKRCGAQEMLELMFWLPRVPQEPQGAVPAGALPFKPMDMSDNPSSAEEVPQT